MSNIDIEMRTVSGKYLSLLAPNPNLLDIKDIAHGLARICRYGAQTKTVYTVGEHSIHVAHMLWREAKNEPYEVQRALVLAGLLHDAAEAYLGDMIQPLKQLNGPYRAIEATWERAIESRFGVVLAQDRIKTVDRVIQQWEMVMFRDIDLYTPPSPEKIAEAFIQVFVNNGGIF